MGTAVKEAQVLEQLFRSLVNESKFNRLRSGLTDLFVRINMESGEVGLYGDDDELLCSTIIFSWVGKGGQPTPCMIRSLKEVVANLDNQGYWTHEMFERPFSVELVNEEFDTVEELLFLDDELIKVSLPLLENLDDELNSFINQLLSK